MIDVRFKNQPDRWVRYVSRKEILDRERWGSVLEVREVEEDAPKHDESAVVLNPQTEVKNETTEPEVVATQEQVEEKQPKRHTRKRSTEDDDK